MTTWTCAKCDEPQDNAVKREFVPDPTQPIAGTRVAVCPTCAAKLKEAKNA